ncbi:MAG: molybdopterin biosynthesis protein, partial [Clostridia bacterium]|nr:molybdopterin biosynthesis protein [Clostridia bacterium]
EKSGFHKKTETVNVVSACGRILSQAVYAVICSPHYNASAMDGIAVSAHLTYGASENTPVILKKGEYTVVDTGDPLLDSTDAVVMIEDVTEDENENVKLISAVSPWQNVRQTGEDICMGDMIATGGTKITPSLCGAFLAGGVTKVEVIKKPVFGIIPTGDEIVPPTSNPGKGEIIEFNSTIFSAMLSEWNAESRVYSIVKDKKELLIDAVKKAKSECDAVLILAGSSAGRDDYTSYVVSSLGEVIIHGIAAKPGKPAVLGISGSTPIIGLPGYPVSAIVIMDEFVKNTVSFYYGIECEQKDTVQAVLAKKVVSSLKYKEYVRVTLGKKDGRFFAVPLPRGAGVITSFTKASGILEVPQNTEGFEAGETVEIKLLKKQTEIEKALIITGSHDPVIDEISDMLKSAGADFSVISSHVGSMGAVSAVRSGLAHMGAVHLLDAQDGTYNESYVKKYFPDGGAVLIKGIGRVQGIMVAAGNPLGINDIHDAVKCRYVNRQRGAGTRILFDYLLKKNGISPSQVDGYTNEKFTHTSVAAMIACGSADAGMGIYSAAKMYGLDFIPVCNEEYDFLVDEKELNNEYVKAFFEMLRSDEFKRRAEKMGGYSFTGER